MSSHPRHCINGKFNAPLAVPSNSPHEDHHKCPECLQTADTWISTGLAGVTSGDPCTERQIPADVGAAKLAAFLGLRETGFEIPEYKGCQAATNSLRRVWGELMPEEVENPLDPIVCAFSAKYLPSLVSAYMQVPCVNGPYHAMLIGVLQSGYSAKYMRTPAGGELYSFYVAQLLGSPTVFPSPYMTGLLIFASYAYEYKSHMQPLSPVMLEKLKIWLRIQARHVLEAKQNSNTSSRRLKIKAKSSKGNPFSSISYDLASRTLSHVVSILHILDGNLRSEALQLSLTRRHVFNRFASIHAEEAGGSDSKKPRSRFECARCRTVVYCCREHQKLDWPDHKRRCFETNY
ncbi:hypothetical protein R3P38DRAFT_3006902 [Favolaschia claudopus]|uniref:MYND-type domain-containing protein n=1 Tax=Favolaschia claudopus TaxID=2862362 RepID=A0AAW0AK31_9AGAR